MLSLVRKRIQQILNAKRVDVTYIQYEDEYCITIYYENEPPKYIIFNEADMLKFIDKYSSNSFAHYLLEKL